MRAITALLVCLALVSIVNCLQFTGVGTVQVGNNAPWPATVRVDTVTQHLQIDYNFGVREIELYPVHSRYQTCPSGCKNYFLLNPMADFAYQSGGFTDPEDSSLTKYVAPDNNGYVTTIWRDRVTGVLVRVQQEGSGYNRIYTFTSVTNGAPTFASTPTNCDSVQCGQALDLMLVIDSSGSITPSDYITEMSYASQVVNSFTIGTYGVHAGLVTFATDPLLRSPLTDNAATLNNVISNAQQQGGETNIGGAILLAAQQFATNGRGGNVPQVIILLTDGRANRPDVNPISYMITQANTAKNNGILIYAIGVGSLVQQSDLNDVASAPTDQYTSLVGNFGELQSTIDSILQQVCVGGEVDGCNPGCYSDTQFCGCGQCLCVGSDSLSCGSRGDWNSATCSCSCTGNWQQTTEGTQTHSCMACSITGCSNGGTIINDAASGQCGCSCPTNWAGPTCDTCTFSCPSPSVIDNCSAGTCGCAVGTHFIAPACTICDSSFCGPNGHTTDPITCNSCTCDANYSGDQCEICDWYCSHNGNVVDCQSCSCQTPWGGDHCDNCVITCQNGGQVNSANGACNCICPAKFGGTNCQSCSTSYCQHGGSTQNDYPTCTCTCPPPWTGLDCTSCGIVCGSHGTINTSGGGCSCTCAAGWSGTLCDVCDTTYCLHGASQGLASAGACNVCTCINNWSGTRCNTCDLSYITHTPHCGTNSVPSDDCSYCVCPIDNVSGFDLTVGPYCDSCNSDLCVNGVIDATSFPDCRCTCPPEFEGRRCDQCRSDLCYHGGTPSDNTCSSCICDVDQFWTGTYCSQCGLTAQDCVHGTLDPLTCTCVCDDYWFGDYCDKCHNGPNDQPICDECSYNGLLNEACTACLCDEYHTGEICSECLYSCSGHGTRSDDCRTCNCDYGWIGDTCLICDVSIDSPYCHGFGQVINPTGACDTCQCRNSWSGNDCSECLINCNNGYHNDQCNGCICNNEFWDINDNCFTCLFECNQNGHPNTNCDSCICDGGYTGSNCLSCDPSGSYVSQCVHDTGVLDADCECDCIDQWKGRYCNECDLTALNCVNGDIIDYEINGEMQCRCRCHDFWVGEQCDQCGFIGNEGNPLYTCPDISLPVITDCSCHCPDYYEDIEGCDICIITNDDCIHELPGSVPDLTKGVCACICEGNWSGRTCDTCDPLTVLCQTGWRLNTDICECEEICGDGLIVGDEQCEVSLINESQDTVCCQNCFFDERRECDDLRACTRYDFCEVQGASISCDGSDRIDYTVDSDRNPIPTGSLSSTYWQKWGISFTSTVPVSIIDPSNTIDPRYQYPTTNIYGGSILFDRIIASAIGTSANGQFCFVMDTASEVRSIAILNNEKQPGQDNSFHIDFYCPNTIRPITVDARNYGAGSVEFIGNPCADYLVTRICYRNFPGAAIGPLYFCDSNNNGLGRLGDYVWYDISVDNIQDTNENPVPGVPVKLFDGVTGQFLAITYTNQAGWYIFEYLYNGDYDVQFNVPIGYTFSHPLIHYPYPLIEHVGTLENNLITDTVKELLTVDVGIYLFGTIGDYIYYDINEDGIQNEAASYGIGGIQVTLFESNDLTTPVRSQVTNDAGYYLFTHLPIYRTADTYHSYYVVFAPPPDSYVTLQFAGTDRTVDCNFDRVSYISDIVPLTPQRTIDLTIDGGIYYCCGSVGDYVWYDNDSNGIQDASETGVANVRVTLYHNNIPVGSQFTTATGYYLFTGLPLSGSYYVHFDRVINYVLTDKAIGTNRESDSDANPNGDTDIFYLTRDRPDRRDIDAGVVSGCTTASECTSNDLCQSAQCVSNQCRYTQLVTCSALTDPCKEPVCQPSTGTCIGIPRITSELITCDDNNECTSNDVCDAGLCKGTPLGPTFKCDDHNNCTPDDNCVNGVCVGTPCTENPDPCIATICDSTGCKDVPLPNAPCDDGRRCTINDICDSTGQCNGTPMICDNNEYCKVYECDERNGQCSATITPDVPCTDGNPCTENDICDSRGRCIGDAIICTGDNVCLNYFCSAGQCHTSVKSTTTPCSDNNECTENDRCLPDGSCAGTAKSCDDNKVCTTDACVAGVCQHTVLTGATCDDFNACTNEHCDPLGNCISTVIDCDDGKECTVDTCVNGQCVHYPSSHSCTDNNRCTILDACDIDGLCRGVPKNCDDHNVCTSDFCNPDTGACEHTNNDNICDDHNLCTLHSVCSAGSCIGYDQVPCTSSDPCKSVTCDAATGGCRTNNVIDGTPCVTSDACQLAGVCIAGSCHGDHLVCNDNDPCTVDSCLNGRCYFTYSAETDNIPCNDGNRCTTSDVCIFNANFGTSKCTGNDMICNEDENPCTTVYCNALTGECTVENFDSTVTCDDSNPCTINDVCVEGVCTGTSKVCSTLDICAESVCDFTTGECVQSVTDDANCNDGNLCTIGDKCNLDGTCTGNPKCMDLISTNECKKYICSDTGDCILVNVDNETPCDDNNACTLSSVCISGTCTGRGTYTCDSDTCNERACVDVQGVPTCEVTFTHNMCDQSTECHDFICSSGSCEKIVSIDCNAGNTNQCIRRRCDDATGVCVEDQLTGVCELDGDLCTADVCRNGVCVKDHNIVPCGPTQCTDIVPCPASTTNCFHNECVNNVCVSRANTCEQPTNTCLRRSCNMDTGLCELQKVINARCDDSNACTTDDICISTGNGVEDVVCRGSNVPCTTLLCKQGTCNPVDGTCSYETTVGAVCNDGNDCTVNDVCDSTANCVGVDKPCDDGNTCTNDRCLNGECVHTNNQLVCNDHNACTINDRCVDGVCAGTTSTAPCAASTDPCLRTVCDTIKGCIAVPVDDGVVCGSRTDCTIGDAVCQSGVCVPAPSIMCETLKDAQCPSVCVNNQCVVRDQPCNDGDECTFNDRCRPTGECVGTRNDCSEFDNGCAVGVCVAGGCESRAIDSNVCDDGDKCTDNYCHNGACLSTPHVCSGNGNVCEVFSCDSQRGCVSVNNPVTCTPSGIYNHCAGHVCVDKVCTEVPPFVTCNDKNPCTEDLCDPLTGQCQFINNNNFLCSDGNACTIDTCQAGRCISVDMTCPDDNNVCTTESCVAGKCVSFPATGTCPLSRGCITSGTCSNKECIPSSFTDCHTTPIGRCQVAHCDHVNGECVVTNIVDGTTQCDDGNACTTGDVCTPSGCRGNAVVCAPSAFECQETYCSAETGQCLLRNNDAMTCHSADTVCGVSKCVNGQCVVDTATVRNCTDNDPCTYGETCTANGCTSTEYSCILSPCIYSGCTDDGFCRYDSSVNTWDPLFYIGFTSQSSTGNKHYIVAVSSRTGTIRGFKTVSVPATSLIVKPYEGGLYGIFFESGVQNLYRIPVNVTDINVLRTTVPGNGQFITRIGDSANTLAGADLTYKPIFQGINKPYTYELYASTTKLYQLDTTRNPARYTQQFGSNFLSWESITWDNHGRFIFGTDATLFKLYEVGSGRSANLCNGDNIIPPGAVIDIFPRYDESVVGATQDKNNLNIFSIRFDTNTAGNAICNTQVNSISKSNFTNTVTGGTVVVTAIALDDTICATPITNPTSNGGTITNTGGGSSPNNAGNVPPPPGTPTTPTQVTHTQGGSGPGVQAPGTTNNQVLTGGTGSIATAVVAAVGVTSVAAFAVFAVILGLNNTKKDPPPNLTAALVTTDANTVASDNPIFQGMNDAGTNILH